MSFTFLLQIRIPHKWLNYSQGIPRSRLLFNEKKNRIKVDSFSQIDTQTDIKGHEFFFNNLIYLNG